MDIEQIKQRADRNPFRPFSMRLSNGATYVFREARDFGAPRDFSTIFYFGGDGAILIDPIHIVEIVDRAIEIKS